MIDKDSNIVRIKCGEIFVLSTDFFLLSCEFCELNFNSLEKLHVHLNQHFPKSPTNIQNDDSDCEFIPLDIKYSLTDNLQDNDHPISTPNEGSSLHTFIANETHKSEQSEQNLQKQRSLEPKQQDEVPSIGLHSKKLQKTIQNSVTFAVNKDRSDDSDETKGTELSCSIRKKFVNRSAPANRIIAGFQCTFCYKMFKSRHNRNDHENSHTGKRPHKCAICDKTFTTYSNLCTHVNMHEDYRPYECSVCGKQFINNAKLSVHKREKHLPDSDPRRYFPCELCDCKLKSYGQLDRHRRIHKGHHRIFTCDYCRKQFTAKGILVQHMRIHSGIKPYKCGYCHTKFRQASNMNQHKRRCMNE